MYRVVIMYLFLFGSACSLNEWNQHRCTYYSGKRRKNRRIKKKNSFNNHRQIALRILSVEAPLKFEIIRKSKKWLFLQVIFLIAYNSFNIKARSGALKCISYNDICQNWTLSDLADDYNDFGSTGSVASSVGGYFK